MGLLFPLNDGVYGSAASSADGSLCPSGGSGSLPLTVGEPVRAAPAAPVLIASPDHVMDQSAGLLIARYYPVAAPPWYSIRRHVYYWSLPPAPLGGYGVFPPAGTLSPSYSLSEENVR